MVVVYKTPLILWVMLDFINIINFALYNNLATFAASNNFVTLFMDGRHHKFALEKFRFVYKTLMDG
jgi:hypothetical protein